VGRQQRGNKDEENVGGEDSPLHHLRLPHAEGALLLRVLKHKLSAETGQGRRGTQNAKIKGDNENKRERERERGCKVESIKSCYLSNRCIEMQRIKRFTWQR